MVFNQIGVIQDSIYKELKIITQISKINFELIKY